MSSDGGFASSWEDRNNAYLGASLQWLRDRLMVLTSDREPPRDDVWPTPRPPSAEIDERPGCLGWLSGKRGRSPQVEPRPEPPRRHHTPAPVSPRAVPRPAELAVVGRDGAPVAHLELGSQAGLSAFECDVLLLAAAAELDPQVGHLCARANPDGMPYPTFGLAMRLFDDPSWDALAPHRPLRRLHLVNIAGDAGVVHAPLRADERVVNFLKGLDHLDERLARLLAPMEGGGGRFGPTASQAGLVAAIERRAQAITDGPVVVNLVGADSASKRMVAEQAAARLGRSALRLPIANLAGGLDLDLVARLWERDSLLSDLALYLDASLDAGDASPETRVAADRLLGRVDGVVFVDSREVWGTLPTGALVLDVPSPTSTEQRAAWATSLPANDSAMAGELAAQFDLDLLTIGHIAAERAAFPVGEEGRQELWRAALGSARPRLDLLAERVEPKASRDDLVLPREVHDQLDRIKEQVRHRARVHADWGLVERTSRGLGISALFAGESGTGKTLAAEVIAAELDLNLYRVDLSAVVSKYIGETEKNLCRLFDGAERGGTILFFDEADALFGKRSEVKDSHDRYANIEVNYLLQRMERYQGLAILATNMKSALDQAFARRLRFVVDFPFPGPSERDRIWRRAFVSHVATDGLDFAHLARMPLTGGSITNVAVNATFAAAAAGEDEVTMPMVLSAARIEYRKLGLSMNEADFRWEPAPAAAGMAGVSS